MPRRILLRPSAQSRKTPDGFKSISVDETGSLKLTKENGTASSVAGNLIIKVNGTDISTPETKILDIVGNVTGNAISTTESRLFLKTITVNDLDNVKKIEFNPPSLVSTEVTNNDTCKVTLLSEFQYNTYRAKLTSQLIDFPGYGYLYNWYAVTDIRGLANPAGGSGFTASQWRVPSDEDWITLATFVDVGVAGRKLKSTLTSTAYPFYGWLNNGGGTDDYNFNALPGSFRQHEGPFSPLIGVVGFFWTSNTIGGPLAIMRMIDSSQSLGDSTSNKGRGLSVRLVREATENELLLNDGDTSDTSSLDTYTGNDGIEYVTVKIGTQVWLAQNLRETRYNDDTIIFNASILGGDPSDSTWVSKGSSQEGAWTAYSDVAFGPIDFAPLSEIIHINVLENSLGKTMSWSTDVDGSNTIYKVSSSGQTWKKTFVKTVPGFDLADYSSSSPNIVQKNLILKKAAEGDSHIEFFPITIGATGSLVIESLNNYNSLPGSQDSSVYVEILEYKN